MSQIEYETTEPPKLVSPTAPVLRFAGGVTSGFTVAQVVSSFYYTPDDFGFCTLIGAAIGVLLLCGLFRLGMKFQSMFYKRPLQERYVWMTFASGIGLVAFVGITAELFGRFSGADNIWWIIVPEFLGLPLICAWLAFEP